MGALAAILILGGLAVELVFVVTSGLVPAAQGLAAQLGELAGSPWLAAGGAPPFLLGVLLLGRKRNPEERFATREALLLLSASAALAFAVALGLGVLRGWHPAALAACAGAGLCEAALAVGLAVRLTMVEKRRKLLFLPGAGLTFLVGVFYVILVTLSL